MVFSYSATIFLQEKRKCVGTAATKRFLISHAAHVLGIVVLPNAQGTNKSYLSRSSPLPHPDRFIFLVGHPGRHALVPTLSVTPPLPTDKKQEAKP